jgi:mannose-6-phosphate isomerase-like protein (cupin superfamily)
MVIVIRNEAKGFLRINLSFETMGLPEEHDVAPDGSLVRPLHSFDEGSLAHCTLPEGCVSRAVRHRTVSEIWFFIEGEGEIWRSLGGQAETVRVESGVSLTIPVGTGFQFRNTGSGSLKFLCVTMPKWPGSHEAEPVEGLWEPCLPE